MPTILRLSPLTKEIILSTLMMEVARWPETSLYFYQTVWGSHPGLQHFQLVLSIGPYFEYFFHIPTHCSALTPFRWSGKTACLQHRKHHKSYSTHSTWKSRNPPTEISPMTSKSNKRKKYFSYPDSLSSVIEVSSCPGRKCNH